MDDFRIELDKHSKVFHPGETLTGTVVLGTIEELYIDGIAIHFIGGATIATREDFDKNYDGSEIFFDSTTQIKETSVLKPDWYQFPFSYKLPNRPLPRKFDDGNGRVVYKVEAILKGSSLFKEDARVSEHFDVVTTVDLKHFPEAKEPGEATVTGSKPCCGFCCLCTHRNSGVKLIATTPYKGTIPGRLLPFTVILENRTRSTVKDVKAELIQKWIYWCSGNTVRYNRTVATMNRRLAIPRYTSGSWKASFRIPPDLFQPTQGQEISHVINVSYVLRFSPVMKRSRCCQYFCEIPIYIGDIALSRSVVSVASTRRGGGEAMSNHPLLQDDESEIIPPPSATESKGTELTEENA